MNKIYECPVIEIISFSDNICTSNNDEATYMVNGQESSNGWLPWL